MCLTFGLVPGARHVVAVGSRNHVGSNPAGCNWICFDLPFGGVAFLPIFLARLVISETFEEFADFSLSFRCTNGGYYAPSWVFVGVGAVAVVRRWAWGNCLSSPPSPPKMRELVCRDKIALHG